MFSPKPNPRVLEALQSSDAVIYGIGSLYTSIAPLLILPGIGEAVSLPWNGWFLSHITTTPWRRRWCIEEEEGVLPGRTPA